MKNKKAQEEIVGFVLIVVIIVIAVLIFFSIQMRKTKEKIQTSTDINMFLESIYHYTTPCAISYETNYISLGKLIDECLENKKCLSGKRACDVLNETLVFLVEAAFHPSENSPIKGYEITIKETNKSSTNPYYYKKGECESSFLGGEYLSSPLVLRLKLCY